MKDQKPKPTQAAKERKPLAAQSLWDKLESLIKKDRKEDIEFESFLKKHVL